MWSGIADMRKHMTAVLDDLPDGTGPMDRILVAVETICATNWRSPVHHRLDPEFGPGPGEHPQTPGSPRRTDTAGSGVISSGRHMLTRRDPH